MNSTYIQLRNNLNYLKLNQMNENLDEVLDYITKIWDKELGFNKDEIVRKALEISQE